MARAWTRPGVRRLVRPLFSARTPSSWVFLCGCYNSGTTILREVLGAHPRIATLPREGVVFTDAFPDLEAGGWQRMWHRHAALASMHGVDPAATARRAIRDWSPWWARGADVFLEKSITHGSRMPFLQQAFPGARFIFVMRNGYCAAEGILRRARPSGAARDVLGQAAYPPAEAARQWVVANETYLSDRPELDNLLEVRYEDFAARPVEVLGQMLEFLGLDDAELTDLGDGELSMGRRRFAIRDQNAESLARLTAPQRAEIAEVIGPTMRCLGYPDGGEAK